MLFWFLLGAIALMTGVGAAYGWRSGKGEPDRAGYVAVEAAGAFILTAFAAAVIFMLCALGLLHSETGEVKLTEPIPLIALADGQAVDGNIFVTRTSDSVRYVHREADGAMVLQSTAASKAKIYEDLGSEEKPYRVDRLEMSNGSWYAPWVGEYTSRTGIVEFHVPKGSVVSEYEIDLTN